MKVVTILLAALNEEEGIAHVLDEIPVDRLRNNGYQLEVLVVDGQSTDGTVDVASRRGATVIPQEGRGKGSAVRTGLRQSPSNYVVMLDADHTYPSEEIPTFLDMLEHDIDIVVGSRLRGMIEDGAMSPINVFGNRALSFLASSLYGRRISDVCSGMWAFGPRALKKLHLNSVGFELEAEIFAEAVKHGLRIREVPISYRRRKGEGKLGNIRDGLVIAAKLLRRRFLS